MSAEHLQSPAQTGGADESTDGAAARIGVLRRRGIPLALAVIACGIYVGSILWFIAHRGGG